MSKYYIVVEEWNYPCESGRNIVDDFDTYEDALKKCMDMCENEMDNFCHNIGGDCLNPEELGGNDKGVILTSKMGLDDYYYACRIVGFNSLDCH